MSKGDTRRGLEVGRGLSRHGLWPRWAVTVAVVGYTPVVGARQAPRAIPIADNSFLIEEAYNQERGIVQHINTFVWSRSGDSWLYAFTQEWPLFGQRNQLSYSVLFGSVGDGARIGDIALNYRFQLVGPETRVCVAPRLTILAPTGSAAAGVGAGGVGLQVNVPVSAVIAPWLVTHWNAGVTETPSAQDRTGDRAPTTAVNLGASAIWRMRPTLNLLVEITWVQFQTVVGPDATAWSQEFRISPGVRWAYNFSSGLQIVPGLAFPFGVGPSRGDDAVLLYLSFEHPFRRPAT